MPRISGELVMTQAPKCARFQLKNTASLSRAGESTPVGHGGHFRTGGLSHWPGAGSDLQKVRLSQPPSLSDWAVALAEATKAQMGRTLGAKGTAAAWSCT